MLFVELVLFIALGISSILDIRYRKISGSVLGMATILLIVLLWQLEVLTLKRVLGAIVVCGMFLGISIITGEKIGIGDGLLFGMVDLAVGLQRNISIMMTCFAIAFLIAVFLFVSRKAVRDTEIPLAPILLFSVAFTLWNHPLS